MRKSRFPVKTGSPARIQGKSLNSPSSRQAAAERRGEHPADKEAGGADKARRAAAECPRDIQECRADREADPAVQAAEVREAPAADPEAAQLPRRLLQEPLKTR